MDLDSQTRRVVVWVAYLGMDGASSRDNASDSLGCEGDVAQQHSSMNGEVVHTLHMHTINEEK